jgi:hypothetical protein
MRLLALGLLVALCSGCASWPTEGKVEESIYVAAEALDDFQTAHYKDYRNDREVWSDAIIGHKPSDRSVILYGVGSEALHFAVTDWLTAHGHDDYMRLWEVVSIGLEIDAEHKGFWITERVW